MSADTVEPPLYTAREPVFPRAVSGLFRRMKWWIMGFCLAVYYVTPWIRWDRGPEMPDQAVLVDLANRRFFFFFIEIWPTEFYYVAGMLIMAGLGLFLFTAVLGRVWCGYACPQTVWTDLFQHVERWIDGDRNAQMRLWNRPWDGVKIRRRAAKWSIWLMISIATGGAWVFYFADAPTLLAGLATGTAPAVAYASIAVLTFTTFSLGGFMREQVCIYMCPWPRIQAAMMDENTLTVAYRDERGEPRGKHRKREGADDLGDCIDCNACVAVCPTGVDIREGQQLGCITCALCIDACDEIMDKVGKPRGLIDYVALDDTQRAATGREAVPLTARLFRPRVFLYTALWAGIGVLMLAVLATRGHLDLRVAHSRNPTFVTLSDGSIRNTYDVTVANRLFAPTAFTLGLAEAGGTLPTGRLEMRVGGIDDGAAPVVEVPADRTGDVRVFVTAPPGVAPAG
ncbi:MAG: cytochrome c oxidase accessory protein CcoG, partial [Pseudomonadota bacterium]